MARKSAQALEIKHVIANGNEAAVWFDKLPVAFGARSLSAKR